MDREIDYGKLMHNAMRGLISEVLAQVRDHGLPGTHHFFITFDTTHPDSRLADWLKDRYPTEMTVVMQHWFDDLDVGPEGFGITLNFGDAPERLFIPFDAIKTFVDPSVEFGLRFESHDEDEDDEDTAGVEPAGIAEDVEEEPEEPRDAEIVSLDSFRK
ncbi:MAG: ClpXP protease specificity-enhancing factor SspB [Roseovarius sp.]|nr:ClpXP protease specificity-enhancing factor SspB [Roseovarius sp.]